MKSNLIIAATSLLGSASAGVHRMKLEKIPLEQQLVSSVY
jgi:saccharopepsin